MRIGAFDLRPRLLPSLATLIVLPILISLGVWQMDRAEIKQQLQVLTQERLQAPISDIRNTANLQEDMNFRRARMKGYFDNGHQYLLDNKIYKGKVGYSVYTPFSFDGGDSWIMVNRGWTASGKDRTRFPNIEINRENTEIMGVLSPPPGKLMQLGDSQGINKSWPVRVRNIDLVIIEKELAARLQPYVLHLDASSEQSYIQDWKPYVDTPQKNQSYAVQWFSMAVVLLLIYISLNSRRVVKTAPKSDEE